MQRGLFEEAPALIDAGKNWKNQTIWTKDNLHVLRGLNSATVDLIYLDPPFNSNRFYEAPIGSEAEGSGFKDTWRWTDIDTEYLEAIQRQGGSEWHLLQHARFNHSSSMASYLVMMSPRLKEMKRVLKPTGSIYLHCDPTASHYLKGLMDMIFGKNNFRNEIVWDYKKVSNAKAKKFLRAHDSILFYSNSDDYIYNAMFDENISPRKQQLIKAGYNTKNMNGEKYLYIYDEEKVKALEESGKLNRENFDIIRHPDTKQGNRFTDVFAINFLNSQSPERVGYPTQKPLELLRRIIKASSNEGETVLDPFCGCATACVAAEELGREWIGIDVGEAATSLVRSRIRGMDADLYRKWDCISRKDQPHRTDLGKLPKATAQKKRLYGEQEGKCGLCDKHFEPRNLEVDHVVPRAKGGTDHLTNLQLLCGSCNRTKGTRSQEQAKQVLKKVGWMNGNE